MVKFNERSIIHFNPNGSNNLDLGAEEFGFPDEVRLFEKLDERCYLAEVPIGLLDRENVVVDDAYVDELAKRTRVPVKKQESGEPRYDAVVAQVFDEDGGSTLYVCGGFHQVAASEMRGDESLKTLLFSDCTLEEVSELRLRYGTRYKPLEVARIVQLSDAAWDLTEWSDDISVEQALSLNCYGGLETKEAYGFSAEESERIREWVKEMCDHCNKSPGAVYTYLYSASRVDPELFLQSRAVGTVRADKKLPFLHLRLISNKLPHRYELQQLVVSIAKRFNLSAEKSGLVAEIISQSSSSVEEMTRLLQDQRILGVPTLRQLQKDEERLIEEKQSPHASDINREWARAVGNAMQLVLPLSKKRTETIKKLAMEFTPRVESVEREESFLKGDDDIKQGKTEELDLEDDTFDLEDDSDFDSVKLDALASKAVAMSGEGKLEPLAELFDQHIRRDLFGYIMVSRDLTEQDIEDVFQAMWLKIVRMNGLGHLQIENEFLNLRGWFRTVALNYVTDQHRSGKYSEFIQLQDYMIEGGVEEGLNRTEVEPQVLDLFSDPSVKRAFLYGLSDGQRNVLLLRYYFELSSPLVAECLGVSEGNERQLHRRGLKQLKGEIMRISLIKK